jgi:predicted deacylase
MDIQTLTHNTIEYIQKGANPQLIVLSGTHGDEHEVIEPVIEYMQRHAQELPDFVCIPRVSPSAVASQTRRNAQKHDVNRHFRDSTDDPEVRSVMEILSPLRAQLCLDVHEDADRTRGCYVYDTHTLTPDELAQVQRAIRNSGASLYTGIDDPADAHLGWHVHDGYVSMPFTKMPEEAGFSGRWLLEHQIVQRAFTLEVPGQAQMFLKRALVREVFTTLLPLVFKS